MNIKDILVDSYRRILTDEILHDLTESQKLKRDVEMSAVSNSFKQHIVIKPRRNNKKKR